MTRSVEVQASYVSPTIWSTVLISGLGSIFLAIMSQIAVPVPLTPIPISMQTFAVFLLGGLLGSKRGTYSVIAYLAQGTVGLPVFAGGVISPFWFIEPRAGFLISFVVAAYIVGKWVEKRPNSGVLYLLAGICLAEMCIYFLGWSWMSIFFGMKAAFFMAVVPFVFGGVLKALASAFFLRGYHFINRSIN